MNLLLESQCPIHSEPEQDKPIYWAFISLMAVTFCGIYTTSGLVLSLAREGRLRKQAQCRV